MKKLKKSPAIGFGVIPRGGRSEDIRIDRERGIAYLSVLNRASIGASLRQKVLICKPIP